MKILLINAAIYTFILGGLWYIGLIGISWLLYLWGFVLLVALMYELLGVGWNDRSDPWYTRYSIWDDRGRNKTFYVRKDDI